MKVWDRALGTVRRLMGQLTVTQRLLMGSLATVTVMGMFLVQQYAAGPAYVALLPGASAADQEEAARFLSASNFEHEMRDGEVVVPADRRRGVIAAMAERQVLPTDNKLMFEELIATQSWTQNQSDKYQAEVVALQNELAGIISRMQGIRSANVIVDVPRNRTLGQPSRAPTASVTVFSSGGIDQATAESIAELVGSSRAGLDRSRVTVVDGTTNRRFRARSADEVSIGTNLELTLRIESEVEEKIYDALSTIPNLVVAVRAQVDSTQTTTSGESVMPIDQGSVVVPTREVTTEMESRDAAAGAEAGVRSNTGASVETGGAVGRVVSESSTETESTLAAGRSVKRVIDPRGFARKLNAVVSVPESAVEALWAQRSMGEGDGDEGEGGEDAGGGKPTLAELEATFETLRDDITAIVGPLIATDLNDGGETGEVTVRMVPVIPDLALIQGAGGASFLGMAFGGQDIGGVVRTGLLSLLAVASMGLVVMTALRSSRRQELPTAEELVGLPPALESELDVIGEAGEVDAALEGREMSEDEIKAQQMRDQVESMVKENPEQAAALISRWVRQDD